MKKPIYAFLIMGKGYQPEIHHTQFETDRMITKIITVSDFSRHAMPFRNWKKKGPAPWNCAALLARRARNN